MKVKQAYASGISPEFSEANDPTRRELLTLYLSLPKEQRDERFADTALAAEITGLSRRTIQFWVEIGAIRAVLIGKRYQIELHSLVEYLMKRDDKHDA